jgi:hypothetical protein
MKRIINTLILCLLLTGARAQNAPAMADAFRADGKIYVVITVIVMIFVSIAVFLYVLERKVTRLERKLKEKDPK